MQTLNQGPENANQTLKPELNSRLLSTGKIIVFILAAVGLVMAAAKMGEDNNGEYKKYKAPAAVGKAPPVPKGSSNGKEAQLPVCVDYAELSEGDMVFNAKDPRFETFSIRIRDKIKVNGKAEERTGVISFFDGKQKGPLVQMDNRKYGFANKNMLTGNRLSTHVHYITKWRSGFALESDTTLFKGSWAEVGVSDILDATAKLSIVNGSNALKIPCFVGNHNGLDLQYPQVIFQQEHAETPKEADIQHVKN